MRTLIDANVILRYVLNDIPEMAKKRFCAMQWIYTLLRLWILWIV